MRPMRCQARLASLLFTAAMALIAVVSSAPVSGIISAQLHAVKGRGSGPHSDQPHRVDGVEKAISTDWTLAT